MKRRGLVAAIVGALLIATIGQSTANPHRLMQLLRAPENIVGAGDTIQSPGIYCKGARAVRFIVTSRNRTGTVPSVTFEGAMLDTAAMYSAVTNWGAIVAPTSLTATLLPLGGQAVYVYSTMDVGGMSQPLPFSYCRLKLTTVNAADSAYFTSIRAVSEWGNIADVTADDMNPTAVMVVPGCSIDVSGNLTVAPNSTTGTSASLAGIPVGAAVFNDTKLTGGFNGLFGAATIVTSKTDQLTATVSPPPSLAITNVTLKFLLP